MQASQNEPSVWHGTTIVTVRKGGKVVIGGDGQVSIGQTVIKANAKKVRKIGKGDVIGGFAGATADAFTLFERLESKLEQYPGQLTRRGGRTRQGLAHRPLFAPPGSDDDRRRPGRLAGADRNRRRAGAGGRRDGDRLRRQLCAGRRPRADRHRQGCRGDRAPLASISPPTSASTPTAT